MSITTRVKLLTRGLFTTGFFDIVGAGFVNKVLSLLMGIVLVRILSKADYGVYAYAFNIASFFIMFNGFGATSAILQICSELHDDKDRADRAYAYGYRFGIVADLLMGAGIIITALLVPLAIEDSNLVLLMYCAYPLFLFLCEVKLTYLRFRLRNREYALMTNIQTVLNVAFSLFGAFAFQIVGLVVGQCLSCVVAWTIMCAKNPQRGIFFLEGFTHRQKTDFWKLSFVSAFNNALGQALTLIGTFLVGLLLIDSELVAEYKVATTLPFAMLFLPSMVITYIYPHFAMHKDDRVWTIRNYARLIRACFVGMGAVSILVAILAEPITIIIFGEQYADAIPILQMLMPGFFVTAAFRQPTGNLLVTQRKLIFNTFVGVASMVFNIGASCLIVPNYGMLGAAVVYDLTMLFGAALNVPYYFRTIRSIGR